MKPVIGVHRRRLLAGVVGGGLFIASPMGDQDTATPGVVAYLAHLSCPHAIGEACLAALPRHEASKQALTDSLFRALLPLRWHRLSAGALARRFREESRRDFARGRILFVNGWMLSRTEARIYALATLPGSGAA